MQFPNVILKVFGCNIEIIILLLSWMILYIYFPLLHLWFKKGNSHFFFLQTSFITTSVGTKFCWWCLPAFSVIPMDRLSNYVDNLWSTALFFVSDLLHYFYAWKIVQNSILVWNSIETWIPTFIQEVISVPWT